MKPNMCEEFPILGLPPHLGSSFTARVKSSPSLRGHSRLGNPRTIWWNVCLIFLLAGCDEKPIARTPVRERVNAVAAKPEKANVLDEFCDVRKSPDQSSTFTFPPLAEGTVPPQSAQQWRWVNVWATWCKPCIEEMPMLTEWKKAFNQPKPTVNVEFLSVDQTAAVVDEFRKQHADLPTTLRIASFDHLAPWLKTLGLDDSATIPIHVFINPSGKIRCVRNGPVSKTDLDTVKRIFTDG